MKAANILSGIMIVVGVAFIGRLYGSFWVAVPMFILLAGLEIKIRQVVND